MNKSQFGIKTDRVFGRKHYYFLKRRPVKNERDNLVFKKSSFTKNERVFTVNGAFLDMITNYKKKKEDRETLHSFSVQMVFNHNRKKNTGDEIVESFSKNELPFLSSHE